MEFWKGKAKKEEEKVARAMIELRKKNAEYEIMTAEFVTSQSERQELRRKIRDLENMLQSRQQQLDTLLKALEEKNDHCDTTSLESRHSYRTHRKARIMEAEFNERIERMERAQKELQEQLTKTQQEARDLMLRSREESFEQKDQMAKMIEMMIALVKGKGPMQSPDIMEPQSRVNHDQDLLYPPEFTPPHAHATQRGYPQGEPVSLE
ncbi:fibrinogen- and Ig-binding protein-like [Gossypium hirsutum]|uniref:Fibrinogen- and Ig-binding protein-like n=1 Tax=Gossypium hirsutum TaxID=3635 RepID=A0A1U8HVI9_GOSHI|nr:fibrinogen- and Ig-binding protein-like [Gossypium hirsutum]